MFTIPTPIEPGSRAQRLRPDPGRELPAPACRWRRRASARRWPRCALRNSAAASLPAGVLTLYDAAGRGAVCRRRPARRRAGGGEPAGRLRPGPAHRRGVAHGGQRHRRRAHGRDGALRVDQRDRRLTHARSPPPRNEPRRVLLEVPKAPGGSLARDFAQPAEETATAWRFAVDLQPGEVKEVTLRHRPRRAQAVALLDDDDGRRRGAQPAGHQRRGPRGARAHRRPARQEAARTAERDQLSAQRDAVEQDEERLRGNLAAVQPATRCAPAWCSSSTRTRPGTPSWTPRSMPPTPPSRRRTGAGGRDRRAADPVGLRRRIRNECLDQLGTDRAVRVTPPS